MSNIVWPGPRPRYGTPEFARWMNGRLTNFCGKEMHDRCRGTISTIGIECPCLCECHKAEQEGAQQ